jgi:hypothetical protein
MNMRNPSLLNRKFIHWIAAGACLFIFAAGVWLMAEQFLFPNRYIRKIYYQSPLQVEVKGIIVKEVQERPEGESLELARLTPFEWDRLCIFGMGKMQSDINQALGISWLDQQEVVGEDAQLFVFTKDKAVIQHLYFSPTIILNRNELRRQDICLSANEAVFIVGGYDWRDTRIKKLLLQEDD